MTSATIIRGNVHEALDLVEDGSVAQVVTSPPYWGRRAYTDDPVNEIGRAQSLDGYLAELTSIFGVVWDKLQRDGLLWVVIGNTAAGSGGAGGDYNSGGKYEGRAKYRQGNSGIPGNQWCDVPGRLLHRLQAGGWLCRADITWDKGRAAPEDLEHVRRPLQRHERIFMLAKHSSYAYNTDAARSYGVHSDVWEISPANAGKKGVTGRLRPKAPFPIELVNGCLLSGKQGLVLDPFMGSGTTLVAAASMGLDSIGIDLDPDAIDQAFLRMEDSGVSVRVFNHT